MKHVLAHSLGLLLACHLLATAAAAGPDFAREIRPILSNRCFKCHGPDDGNREAGLRLDLRDDAVRELDSGARAVVPGRPLDSELIARINGFFGFPAVRQIRIVQKPVSQAITRRRKPQPLRGDAAKRLDDMMNGIESEALRKAVERLGTAVLQKKPGRKTI